MAAALQAAAAVGGGIAAAQKLEQVNLPKVKREQGTVACKLSVQVLGAAVPGLDAPGLTVRQRPFLEARLGGVEKATEYADYKAGLSSQIAGAGASECPWRFNDTLTFSVRLNDILGTGLGLSLRSKAERSWGFVQFDMAVTEIGEGGMDLRQRVLPACVHERGGDGRAASWSSPVMLVPLRHVRGGICGARAGLGEAVAHVACVFSVDREPEGLLSAAENLARRREGVAANARGALANGKQRVEEQVRQAEDQVARAKKAVGDAGANLQSKTQAALGALEDKTNAALGKIDLLERELDQRLDKMVLTGAEWASSVLEGKKTPLQPRPADDGPLADPDFDPRGWLCKFGPDGQTYWHHESMGPPPWEPDVVLGEDERKEEAQKRPLLALTPRDAMKRASKALEATVNWLPAA